MKRKTNRGFAIYAEKHTPGPWHEFSDEHDSIDETVRSVEIMLRRGGTTIFGVLAGRTEEEARAAIDPSDPERHVGNKIVMTGNGPDSPWNARLISAAPDLLAVASRLLEETGPYECGCNSTDASCLLCDARDAIAKAKGGTP